ncbi:MAG: transglycosylase SLT domain-containing protein, partial [bacterium]
QGACFNTLFYKYPDGQFAAEALANIFYDKVKSQKYFMAKKLGKTHLSKFANSKSAPKVMFWMAKVSERTKNYEQARAYYRKLIRQYPDDYYAYHAFLSLNRFRYFNVIGLKQKNIEFPYKNSGYGFIIELAKVKDYGLINQLCKDDDFIQSWLAYLQGNFSQSAVMARDAMGKLPNKPDRLDLRWRLVYPVHYYNEIKQNADYWDNDSILILSIIREESYFNPNSQSAVGAKGLMQLMPATAREAGNIVGINIPNEKLLFAPDVNIQLGNVYYSRLKRALLNKDILAVLAYNGGLGSVSKWKSDLNYYDVDDFVEQIPYSETQNYLKKVYKSYWNYLRIYDGVNF